MLWRWTQLVVLQFQGLCQYICSCIATSYIDLGLGVQMSLRLFEEAFLEPCSFHSQPWRWPALVGLAPGVAPKGSTWSWQHGPETPHIRAWAE